MIRFFPLFGLISPDDRVNSLDSINTNNGELYEHIAKNCNRYSRRENPQGLTNEVNPKKRSCETCRHFIEGRCELDLFDNILSKLE